MVETSDAEIAAISECLARAYGVGAEQVISLPLGNDAQAAVYRIQTVDHATLFLKVRFGPVFEPGLLVARALHDRGVSRVIAPLSTRQRTLWAPLDGTDGWSVVVYPFIEGQSAKIVGMNADQWRTFGGAMRAVHGSGLGEVFRDQIRVEDFTLPAADVVRRLLTELDRVPLTSAAATEFAAFWRAHTDRITGVLARAEDLGRQLRHREFEMVLCHGDIHLTNVLVGNDGQIWLVDWDGPLVAPRERDLLFVVGSRIGRRPTPREEDWFFEGYGPTMVDPIALIYYRYERRIEDLGENSTRVFHDDRLSEAERAETAAATEAFFAPGGDFEVIENVARWQWPSER
jgi:spectinomycin phosphotransferase